MVQIDTVERIAIITYVLLQELHRVFADPGTPDEVTLGVLLGTAMHCDDKVGPFRAQRLMHLAPHIVLKSDAHVTEAQMLPFASVLQAFGAHLQAIQGDAAAVPSEGVRA